MGNLASVPPIIQPATQWFYDFYATNIPMKQLMAIYNTDNDYPSISFGQSLNLTNVKAFHFDFGANGYKPNDASIHKQYPLHIWVQGTFKDPWKFDDKIYTNYMANHGFVSASVVHNWHNYPLFCHSIKDKSRKIFDDSSPDSIVTKLCELDFVDCDLGIVVSGFSQGGQLALLSSIYIKNYPLKGIHIMNSGYNMNGIPFGLRVELDCLKYNELSISQSRIRAITTDADELFGDSNITMIRDEVEQVTGYKVYNGDCKSKFNCIQDRDGSGWYIAKTSEVTDSEFNKNIGIHSWRARNMDTGKKMNDVFYDGCPKCEFSLHKNHQWLVKQVYDTCDCRRAQPRAC